MAAHQPVVREPDSFFGHLSILGRREQSLDERRDVQRRCNVPDSAVDLVLTASPGEVATIVEKASPGGIIANSTGLGKTESGWPLSDATLWPADAVAWDVNYRGPLTFLQ